ncbi:hypothetical protein BHE16_00990 [Neomicrococcus aestuarii]|uniref:Serine protease n=2 Tax=Neomicrococcus aestuarii TaxID=556325 RepID=A0A1L2ZKU5_9MICC|nr:hypothetical protein BHE16_00990 [Neomicrococcus aestuarii]
MAAASPAAQTAAKQSTVAQEDPDVGESWEKTIATVKGGVARISNIRCDGTGGNGTAFLIGERFVMTAAHVVDDAAQLSVEIGGQTFAGETVGLDSEADLAVIRMDGSSKQHAFKFASKDPEMGTEIAVIGYPLSEPLSVTRGTVSGLNRNPSVQGSVSGSFIQVDASINPGNSGGPLISLDGEIVGVASSIRMTDKITGNVTSADGINFATAVSKALPAAKSWVGAPQSGFMDTCASSSDGSAVTDEYSEAVPQENAEQFTVDTTSQHPDAETILSTFQYIGESINMGDYDAAFSAYSSDLQSKLGSSTEWSKGLQTTQWMAMRIFDVETSSDGDALVKATLVTEQDAKDGVDGQTCSAWYMFYGMVVEDGYWAVDSANTYEHSGPRACSDF